MAVKKQTAKKKAGDARPSEKTMRTCQRVMIEKVSPEIDGGAFPIKRVVGEQVIVRANVFTDGHEEVFAVLWHKKKGEEVWRKTQMKPLGNDRWSGYFTIEEQTDYLYSLAAGLDRFGSWRSDMKKKAAAGQDVGVDIMIGLAMLEKVQEKADRRAKTKLADCIKKIRNNRDIYQVPEDLLCGEIYDIMLDNVDPGDKVYYGKELRVSVEREKALFSSWYEFFPRSWGKKPGNHGDLKQARKLLPEISRMGFDVVYLPPIHPIGITKRKGKDNFPVCKPDDPGSPWAIGSDVGGHKAIHPQLGKMEDLKDFIKKAEEHGMEVALDLAYQCSPDHPYVKKHPEWFIWRPDGTVQFAENPPKKYEDVLPINFETEDKMALWEELKSIVTFWIGKGVKIFRVDNPHTKPFVFWDWIISEIRKDWPDVIFLAEAFTRPNVMYRIAKAGFSQSYTYFTWRITKQEITGYMEELTRTEVAEIMRPNFWPNTPDILPEHLQYGGRPMFIIRAVLAATLSSNFGIYGPAFELCVSDPVPGKEEYRNSEKYEIKQWNWDAEGNLKDILARINGIRKQNPALQITRNVVFCATNNEKILCYYKSTGDYSNIILVVVTLDAYHKQSGTVRVPLSELGLDADKPYLAHDLLSGDRYVWQGEDNYVELDPAATPAHIIKLRRHTKSEEDFDYFM